MYRQTSKKSIIFKFLYLTASIAVFGFALYLLTDYIVYGFKSGVNFDDCIVLIASVISLLFEGSIIGFIIRSFKAPTILMKNLVFKNDGTPYKAGIIAIIIGAAIFCALAVTFLVSAYGKSLLEIPVRAQRFIASVGMILFVNLTFTAAYYLTFRHESGSFAII